MAKVITGPGWTATGKGVTRRYAHSSGWSVFHCGHPTALCPWAVVDPEGLLHTCGITCQHGRAFRFLNDAIAHAEGHLAGRVHGEGRPLP